MNRRLTGMYVRTKLAMEGISSKVRNFLTEEKGGAEIIATIVLVAIVVLLALFFREQIGNLVSSIWSAIAGKEDELTQSFSAGGGGAVAGGAG